MANRSLVKPGEKKEYILPIKEEGKWGFANEHGETRIEPIYEKAKFFYNGLAAVKKDGKYGYLRKDGKWQIKPKYESASSFISICAQVTKGANTYCIDQRGRKMKASNCYPMQEGCILISPRDPEKYFIKVNGKYELEYHKIIFEDSLTYKAVADTTNLQIDTVERFSSDYILVRKNNKYGLFHTWTRRLVKIYNEDRIHDEEFLLTETSKWITYKYDELRFEIKYEREVNYAEVRIDNAWGVIDGSGRQLIEVEYDSIKARPGMAFVEFEPNRFGYKSFRGKEYFKRNN